MESIAKIRRMYHVDGKEFKTMARELNKVWSGCTLTFLM